MASRRTRRPLLIAAANLGVLLALLGVTELACRFLARATTELRHPEQHKLPPKDASELRVFAFGASTVWGEPVPEVGFVAQMQYWLQRLYPDRDIKIYNFGQPGKDTGYVLNELTRRFDDKPDLMIVVTGGNEFVWWVPATEGRIARARDMLSTHFATMRLLQWAMARFMKSQEEFLMPCQVQPWDRQSVAFKNRMSTFTRNMGLIVEQAHQRGVKLIVGTLPSNIADWPPVYKKLAGRDQRYSETVLRIQGLIREAKYQGASEAVKDGFQIYADDAMLYFLQGRIQSANGDYAAARDSFLKAKDLDPFPWRTSSEINSTIRKLAAGVPDVYLVDLEKEYGEHSANGLVGFDLIADNVHGTPRGESVSAQAMMQAMAAVGFLPSPAKLQQECCPLSTFLADSGYLKPKSPLLLHALLDTATFAMKSPFLNYDASRMYLFKALQVDEGSWEVWANLATLSYLTGDTADGSQQLQRATELHRGPLNTSDRDSTPYLKEALEGRDGRARKCAASL
jgi:tetratricopeptide (TPR) repeat protein